MPDPVTIPNEPKDPKTTPADPAKPADDAAKKPDPALAAERKRMADSEKRANAAEKELADIKATQAKAEQDKLAEQGKFKELAEAADKKRADAEACAVAAEERARQITKRASVMELLRAANCLRPAEAIKLAVLDGVKLGDDGVTVTGAEEAVNELKERVPELFSDQQQRSPAPPTDKGRPGSGGKNIPHPQPKTVSEALDNMVAMARGK